MPAEAVDARTLASLGPVRGVDVGAVFHHRWDRRNRLDVIDDRRAAIEADHRREGRLQPWVAALALQRFEQRALLAADIGSRAAMHRDIEIEATAEDVLAQQPGVIRLAHR